MTHEELVKSAEAAKQKCSTEYQALTQKIKDVLGLFIKNAGLSAFTKVRHVNDSCMEIEIERPGKDWGHTFSLYYHTTWGNEKRKLELNVGTFGSFSSEDTPEINFYIAAGKFASCLGEIQSCFENIDFEKYYAARDASYRAGDELRRFDDEAKKLEDTKRQAEIELKLVPGAKIKIGVDWYGKDKIDEIVKVTPKRVYFSHYAKCLSKDEVIRNFMRSSKAWIFTA